MSLFLLLIVFSICSVLGCCNNYKWKVENLYAYVLVGILLVVAATFRPTFMPDYESYVETITSNIGSERLEPSFYLLSFLGRISGTNPLGTFFLYALFGTGIMMYVVKRDSKFVWFSILLFISIYFILGEMIQIRQAVAISLVMFSIKYIYDKSLKKYLITTIAAVLFHYSAIIMLPLYYLSPTRNNPKPYIYSIGICLIIGTMINFGVIVDLINVQLISDLYYIKTAQQSIASLPPIYINIRFLIQIFICLFFWYYADKLNRYNKFSTIYLKLYSIGLCVFLLFYNVSDLADRLSTMFLIVEIMLIPMVINVVKPIWVSKLIILVIALKYFTSSISSYILHG